MAIHELDDETLREIIKCQMEDNGIPYQEYYFMAAREYYDTRGEIPTLDMIISGHQIIQESENRYNSSSESESEQTDDPDESENENENDSQIETAQIHNGPQIPNVPQISIVPQIHNGPQIPNLPQVPNSLLSSLLGVLLSPDTNMQFPTSMEDVKMVLKKEALDNLKLIFIKEPTTLGEKNQCLTCYDDFVKSDLVRILPCGHTFHRLCIDEQLLNVSHNCPVCNQSAGEYYAMD